MGEAMALPGRGEVAFFVALVVTDGGDDGKRITRRLPRFEKKMGENGYRKKHDSGPLVWS